jgi:hypothetical protein
MIGWPVKPIFYCDAFALTPSSSRGGVLTTPSSTSTSLNDKKSSSSKKTRASPGGFASKLQEMRASKFPYAGEVRPGQQSPQRQVLDSTITRPDYADTGVPVRGNKPMLRRRRPTGINAKGPETSTSTLVIKIVSNCVVKL